MNSSRAKSHTENHQKEERLTERKAKIRGLKRTKAITKKDKSKETSNNRNARSSSSKKTYKREFEVEKILDRGMYKGKVHFLIKWKGYSKKQSTWEPLAYLGNAPKKIRLFEKKYEGQPIRELKSLAVRGRSKSKKTDRKKKEGDSDSSSSSSEEGSVSSSEAESVASTTSRKARKQSATPNAKNKSSTKKEKKARKTKSSAKSEALLADLQHAIDASKQPQSILSKRSSSKVIDSNNQNSTSWFNLVKKTKMNSGLEEIKVSQAGSKSPLESESGDDFGEAIDYRNKEAEAQVYDLGIFSARNNPQNQNKEYERLTKQKSSFIEEHPPAQDTSSPNENEKISTPVKSCMSLPNTQSSSDSKLNKNTPHESEIPNKESVIKTLDQQDLDVPRSRLDTIQTEFDTKIEIRSGSFQSLTTIDSHLPPSAHNENSMEELNEDDRKKQQITLGSFGEGDIPVRVLAAKPIPEEEDLELLVLWRRRPSGVQPEKSKIMRLEFLEKGYHMLLVEYYERKMSLASISNFNPKNLPKHHSSNSNNQLF